MEDYVTIGRTVDDLVECLHQISNISASRVVCFVHNLSYDLPYMERTLQKHFDDLEIFYTQNHHSLTARCGNIELRCSYRLANNSLAGWCKSLGTECIKASGAIDYKELRYPWSELTDNDWYYQVSDVMSMRECISISMQGFNITSIPLTSTGFVRYDCRKAAKEAHWFKQFMQHEMTPEVNEHLMRVFAGGYTHGNRYRSEETIRGDIFCYDFTSSYPARILYNDFPTKAFRLYGDMDTGQPIEAQLAELEELRKDHAVFFNLYMKNPEVLYYISMPYISASKCFELTEGIEDNGRALKSDYLAIKVTDVDFDIIMKQYTYDDIYISDIYYAPKGKLPEWLRDQNREYFRRKCQLDPDTLDYVKSKNKLNGIYGMCATKVLHTELHHDIETGKLWEDEPIAEEKLAKYFHSRNNFNVYAWGVWVTAWARKALFDLMEAIASRYGWEHILYTDTDSVYMDIDASDVIEAYNEQYHRLAKENNASFVNIKGETKELGLADLDKTATAFRYMHSKCYAYEDAKGLHATIAGVAKSWRDDPTKSNADELGSIDNLKEGFTFTHCGGTRTAYNYNDEYITIGQHELYIGNSAVICDTEYKVSNLPEIGPDGLPLIYWERDRVGNYHFLKDFE